jgi:YD repeat-containing protein
MIQSWGNDGRLANRRLERSSDAVRLSSLTYAYDATDNITGITDTLVSGRTRSFAYDPVDRLSRVTGTFSGFAREDIVHDTWSSRPFLRNARPLELTGFRIVFASNRHPRIGMLLQS